MIRKLRRDEVIRIYIKFVYDSGQRLAQKIIPLAPKRKVHGLISSNINWGI